MRSCGRTSELRPGSARQETALDRAQLQTDQSVRFAPGGQWLRTPRRTMVVASWPRAVPGRTHRRGLSSQSPARVLRAGDLPDARKTDNSRRRRNPPGLASANPLKTTASSRRATTLAARRNTPARSTSRDRPSARCAPAHHLQRRKPHRIPVIDGQLPASEWPSLFDAPAPRH